LRSAFYFELASREELESHLTDLTLARHWAHDVGQSMQTDIATENADSRF
jgi:hypothetical protein